MPATVTVACHLALMAANLPTFGYALLTLAAANLLRAHGSEQQKLRYMLPMLDGRFTGTMCLSEPHAGSSLAEIRASAVPDGAGGYLVTGDKMWISGGDHELTDNIVHLVLARLPDAAPGARGISLFIVPKRVVNADGTTGASNGVELVGLNKKMGFRGLTNCALRFEGAAAELVGSTGAGLAQMFHMMDEARLDVGMNSAALAHHAYIQAVEYARERRQGKLMVSAHDDPQVPILAHGDVRRMLLAQKAAAEGSLALILYAQRRDR